MALIGRDEERRAVETALDGGGCIVAGPAGVGKTRLVADVVAGLPPDRSVIRVVATASAATLPFGAVSHLLPEGAGAPTIADFVTALRDGQLGPNPVLVIDDAQSLDDASAALVLAVATTRVAQLLVTLRSQEPAPSAVATLWRDRHLDRVDLQPLAQREVELVVDDLLSAPSHARAYEWIHRLAGGNPLFVTELVADGRRTGRLELRDGRWHLGEGHAPLERMHDLLGAHIGSVSEEARAALDVLALDAPVPLALVEDLVPAAALEELERSRLATVRDDRHQGLLVDLAHPLYGELVRDALPETSARRIRRDLARSAIANGTTSPTERLRTARLLLESGQVDEERFLEAASIALAHGAPDLARRLAEVLPPSLPAALCTARGLVGLGRLAEVDGVLAPFEAAAAAADPELAATYVQTRTLSLLTGPGEQPVLAHQLVERVGTWRDDGDWRALIAGIRCWVALRNCAYRSVWGLVEAPLADPTVSPGRRLLLLQSYWMALQRLARIDDGQALAVEMAELTRTLGGTELDLAGLQAHNEGSLIVAGRDLAAVRGRVVLLIDQARQRGNLLGHLTTVYLLGELEHVQGHHAEAVGLYQRALDLSVDVDANKHRPIVHVMLAISAAYLGDERTARRAIADAEASMAAMPGVVSSISPELARARAMAELAAGRESVARDQLLAQAAAAGDDVLIESESLHVALLLGADAEPCATRLEALAGEAQDDMVQFWARHARAVADRDPAAQLAAAEAFEAAGLDLDAAQAAALAAAAHRAAGLQRGATLAAAIATRTAARCPGVKMPALASGADVQQLTHREREIAGLAARGATNADIAEALTLSQRTVETYVLRVYRKLGVNNRRGLAKVLSPEAAPAPRSSP